MIKINVIIAKRGRDDYLKLALHNFNQSDNIHDYDIGVYIGEDIEDNINKIDYSVYGNLKVYHLYIPNLPQAGDLFCKGHIMDMLLRQMRQDYDFICVVDTDIVYRKSFFKDITSMLGNGECADLCLNTSGFYTDKNTNINKILSDSCSYDEILRDSVYVKHAGCSQISITKAYHEKVKRALKIKSIYDTGSLGYYFMGWGREDTLVKKIMDLSRAQIIMLHEAWVHLWHPHQEAKEEALSYNTSILSVLEEEVMERSKSRRFYIHPLRKKLKGLFTRQRIGTSTKVQ